MGKVMTNTQFAEKARDIALNYKTLYVMGCFGAPLNNTNKNRYCNNHEYNKRAERTAKIRNASADTFGFDCVCLIKGILWGWNGNTGATYGGAKYASNGVPDVNADGIMKYCTDVSTNFSNIQIGEIVHMSGHVGIHIGDGLVVECTPIWKDKVQITALGNIGKKNGYNTRTWVNHGKLNFVDYSSSTPVNPTPSATGKYKIGDTVVISGNLYTNSNADTPAGNVENKVTKITRYNQGSKHPYNTTGDLGWMNESDIKLYEDSKIPVNPTPIPTPSNELKVGDKVKIIGKGNGSSYGTSNVAYGLGWEREILKIYPGRPYPYQVGNSTGTTGFYKDTSLQKI